LFGLPANKKEFNTLCYVVRGDLMKKYNIPDIKALDDLGAYLDAVAKNEKGIIPYDTNADDWMLGAILSNSLGRKGIGQGGVVSIDDLAKKVTSGFDQPELADFRKKMRDWNQKSYWSKNALANKTPVKDSFEGGKSAAAIVNLANANQMYLGLQKTHPEWDVKVYNAYQGPVSVLSYMINGMAINAKAKNPERALMLLDLFKNKEEYNVQLNYGIKDKHYTVNAEGKLEFPAENGYPPNAACPWGWNNEAFDKPYAATMPNYQDIMAQYQQNYKEDTLREFNLDISNMSEVDSALTDINKQYGQALTLGFIKDIDKATNEILEKAKAANIAKYLEEAQKQVDAFLAEYQKATK
jgi:putative aldouronate transport system substrate-binding protein